MRPAALAVVALVLAFRPALSLDPGLPPISPNQCYTNPDCDSRSYCDIDQGAGPWECHPVEVANCANHTQLCLHNGFTLVVGCNGDSDCQAGSYCKNTLEQTPPYVCEGDDAPICSCSCVGDWTGAFCDVWSGGPNPGQSNKTQQYIRNAGANAMEEYEAQRLRYNVFDGNIGRGFDARTGALRAPVLNLDFSDPSLTWNGHRLPKEVSFSMLSTGVPTASFSSHALNTMDDVGNVVTGFMAGSGSSPQPFVGQLYTNDPSAVYTSYFSSDVSVGVSQAAFTFAAGTLKVTSESLHWNRNAVNAMNILPPYSAATSDLYAVFFDTFGTGVVSTASSGCLVETISRFPYELGVSQPKAPASLSAAALLQDLECDFMVATGMAPTGTSLSAAAIASAKGSMDAAFTSGEMSPDPSCIGGDISAPCGSQAWLASVPTQAAFLLPVAVQTTPIASLPGCSLDIGSSISVAVGPAMAAQQSLWTDGLFCPQCGAGASCSGKGTNACTCPVVTCQYAGGQCAAYSRLCDKCDAGWGGANCATPQCNPTCNAGHSTCVNVNQCQCRDGYSGSTCNNAPHHHCPKWQPRCWF